MKDDEVNDIMRECGPKWFRFVRYVLGSGADAEDAIQDAFTRVLKTRPDVTGEPLRLYLQRAVKHSAFTYYKRNRRSQGRWAPVWVLDTKPQNTAPAPDLDESLLESLPAMMAQLPPKQYEALLFITQGSSLRECCAELKVPYSTLRARKNAAIENLRRLYNRESFLMEVK